MFPRLIQESQEKKIFVRYFSLKLFIAFNDAVRMFWWMTDWVMLFLWKFGKDMSNLETLTHSLTHHPLPLIVSNAHILLEMAVTMMMHVNYITIRETTMVLGQFYLAFFFFIMYMFYICFTIFIQSLTPKHLIQGSPMTMHLKSPIHFLESTAEAVFFQLLCL